MNAIIYHPGCTYLRSDSKDEVLKMAERYTKKGFMIMPDGAPMIFDEKTSTKGVVEKPKYYEVTLVTL